MNLSANLKLNCLLFKFFKAQDLGLHRSATNWNIPKAEIELRRRLWYATYVMDRWVSRAFKQKRFLGHIDFDRNRISRSLLNWDGR